jgi:hypothetical protein
LSIDASNNHKPHMKQLTVLFSSILLTAAITNGQNLLLNGDFETAGPAGWYNWTAGGGVAYNNNSQGNSTYYVNAWGGTWGNSSGWFQNVPVTAGLTYSLKVDSATENWWNPEGKIGLQFKDAGGNNLQNYELVVANYANSLPWTTYTLTETAPANATSVNIDLKFYGGGSVMFDNAYLTLVPEPGTLSLAAAGALLLWAQSRRNRRP